jgi:hypothetical protein
MSKLVVVMFPDAGMIQEAIDALKKLRAERHIGLYASTVVARDASGKLSNPRAGVDARRRSKFCMAGAETWSRSSRSYFSDSGRSAT